MRELPSYPPRPGVRRHINEQRIETEEQQNEFRARIDTIQRAGLIAEVTVENQTLHIYATRRTRTTRSE